MGHRKPTKTQGFLSIHIANNEKCCLKMLSVELFSKAVNQNSCSNTGIEVDEGKAGVEKAI